MMTAGGPARNPESRGWGGAVGRLAHHRRMRCPSCGDIRIAAVAVPGEEPGPIRVCLRCAHLWTSPVSEPAAGGAESD